MIAMPPSQSRQSDGGSTNVIQESQTTCSNGARKKKCIPNTPTTPTGSKRLKRPQSQSTASEPIRTPHTNTGMTNQCAIFSETRRKTQTVSIEKSNDICRLVRLLL